MDPRTTRELVIEKVGEREVAITRSFAAPRRLVFDAWTQPDHVRQWMVGPGWTMPICEIDLRVGGRWRYVMHGLEPSMAITLSGVYRELAAPDRLVTTEAFADGEGRPLTGRFRMYEGDAIHTVTFVETAGVTELRVHIVYPTRADRDHVVATGMRHGLETGFANLDRLIGSAHTCVQ